jgi:hypothetical protein
MISTPGTAPRQKQFIQTINTYTSFTSTIAIAAVVEGDLVACEGK